MTQQYINIILSDGDSLQVIADVDVEVATEEPIHLANLLANSILQKLVSQERAVLNPGKYTIRLLATVVGATDE